MRTETVFQRIFSQNLQGIDYSHAQKKKVEPSKEFGSSYLTWTRLLKSEALKKGERARENESAGVGWVGGGQGGGSVP